MAVVKQDEWENNEKVKSHRRTEENEVKTNINRYVCPCCSGYFVKNESSNMIANKLYSGFRPGHSLDQ